MNRYASGEGDVPGDYMPQPRVVGNAIAEETEEMADKGDLGLDQRRLLRVNRRSEVVDE